MPDMPLVDMAGEPFKLSALKGQTVIVNIIAMNSPHSLSFSSGRTYYTFRQVMPSSKLLSAVETLFFLNIPVDGERLTIVHLLADDAGAPITQAAMTRWYKAMRMEQRGKGHVLVRWSGELLKSPPAPSMRIVDPEGRVTFRTDTTEKPIHWTQELIELEKVVLTRAERYPPKQYPPNPDPGLALFHGRQWAALDAHLDALRKRPRDPQRLRSPYQLAVGKLGTVSTKELPTIEAWIEARPKSVHARWLLGAVLISYAWQARGGGYANTVSDKGWKLFHERVRQARAALESALELDPKHGPSWSSLIVVAMAVMAGDIHRRGGRRDARAHAGGGRRDRGPAIGLRCRLRGVCRCGRCGRCGRRGGRFTCRGEFGEFGEEFVGQLLHRALNQPGAELGHLAADLGIGRVAQDGAARAVGLQRHIGGALAEAGGTALALARNAVALRRIEIRQGHLAVEGGLHRADLGGDDGGILVLAGLLDRLAAWNAVLERCRIDQLCPDRLRGGGDAVFARKLHGFPRPSVSSAAGRNRLPAWGIPDAILAFLRTGDSLRFIVCNQSRTFGTFRASSAPITTGASRAAIFLTPAAFGCSPSG